MKRFGFRRAVELWWTLRAIVKLARKPMPIRCSLCGHGTELHGRKGCSYLDCLCPRESV